MTAEPKFTPGPWERLIGFAEHGHPIYEAGKLVIRIVQKRERGQAEFRKIALVDSCADDAALIAAAPTLYDVLAEWEDPGACGCDTFTCSETCLPARTRAALSAARGE